MRLLNVDDLCVYEFNDNNRPPYAILSHTWDQGEVSFQSIHTPEATSMAGYAKILKCCEIAKQDGFEYVWIDTCCIDKTSSAELSEAINSMFMWYKSASVCYAYLADMSLVQPTQGLVGTNSFYSCLWFGRGWTLQELLAPETVVFYNREWVDIGTKHSLRDAITNITGIPPEVLMDSRLLQTYNVAERMSWAAERDTTRVEDRAYSLMGLFGVNMPLLYGEGNRAFRRLQLEIMKDSSDESIFLWSSVLTYQKPPQNVTESDRVDMLAPSPPHSRKINTVTLDVNHRLGQPFMMTNKGLHIWLQCKQISDVLHLAALNCTDRVSRRRVCIVIYLDPDTGDCARVRREGYVDVYDWDTVAAPRELYIKQIFDTGGQSSTGELPADSTSVRTTFKFIKNINPETGYHLECLYGGYAGKWGPSDVKSNDPYWSMFSLECAIFDLKSSTRRDPTGTNLGILYFVVKSIQEPDIQALIVVGRTSKTGSPKSYHYRVFRGSKMPQVLKRIAKSDSPGEWKSLFAETFPERDGSLIHYNDRITERLNANCIIRMTLRKGPYKVSRFTDHQILYVHIAFGRTPIEGEVISDAYMTEG